MPQPGERKVAVIGKDIARTLDKHVGDDITLLGEKFRVIGISNYTSIINRNAVVVELADLQEITFRTGAVTFISVKLAPPGGPEEADRVAKAIEGLGQLSVTKSESVLKNDSLIGLLSAVSTAMAWVALLMGVLMVLNTLLMAVLERTREIGILSAIGWSKRRIMGALVIEGLHPVGARQRRRYRDRRCRVATVERDPGHRPLYRREPDAGTDRGNGGRGHHSRHSRLALPGHRGDTGKPCRGAGTRLAD